MIKIKVKDNETAKTVTLEPAVYQDRHVYEGKIDNKYFTLYQRDDQWIVDDEVEISSHVKEQIIQSISGAKGAHAK